MKNPLLLFILLFSSLLFSQTPGGVLGEDLWYKTDAGSITQNEYNDYGPNDYEISQAGTIQAGLFNYNHSLDFGGGNLNFPYSVEDMKVATIFMVYTNSESGEESLIHSEWANGLYNGDANNEKRFSYTTKALVKEDFDFDYPEDSEEPVANALVNTLNWFDFQSGHINNSTGTGGESTVFIGKADPVADATVFSGLIPEFIIYRKALSKEERQRVESYLAIKYGITLTSNVDYYNSIYKKIWEKENNTVFGNRIIAIGRDDTSGLYQKQSTSSHTENKEIILNVDELASNNDSNEGTFDNDQFIFIGDNNESTAPQTDPESETGIADWTLHPIERVWLVHCYDGETVTESVVNIETELRYDATLLLEQIQHDYEEQFWDDITIWLFINRSGDEQNVGDFTDLNQVEYYMPDAIEGNHVLYKGLKWDEDLTNFDQFTFIVGPKIMVDIHLHEMECTDTVGAIDIELTMGKPDFSFRIYDENENLAVPEVTNWEDSDISFNNLPNGLYTLEVEDATGYIRSVDFEVSPTAGMNEDLLEDEYALVDGYVTIDASEHVTAENVTYEWFAQTLSIGNSAEITLDKPGTYEVVVTNSNGCQVSDTTTVTGNPNKQGGSEGEPEIGDSLAGESIRIYPNPTQSNQEFTVEIDLLERQNVQVQVYDFTGSLIHNEILKDVSKYKWHYKIFQSGSYMISVSTKDQKSTKKLIIK